MQALLNRLLGFWRIISGSLWFLPTCFVAAAAALAVGMIELSSLVDGKVLSEFPRLFGATPDSSRSMLGTIAGSMITVAGVTFSIMVVAVAQATSQYTPRILRNFMRDRRSQTALGFLVGVFVYCLVVIRTIRGDEELQFVPSIAVLSAFVLALVAVGFLIYFIHHIASTLEPGSILAGICRDTVEAIDRLFPEELGHEPESDEQRSAARMRELENTWQYVPARTTGYIQSLDDSGLLAIACEHRAVLRMRHGVGDFVVEGTPLLTFSGSKPKQELVDTLNDMFIFSDYRTVSQDAAFGIRQMVDMATKALSPGVNDVTTAINCVDFLSAAVVRLTGRSIPSRYRYSDGELRVIACVPTFEELLHKAISEIRQSAASNVRVLQRLVETLETAAGMTSSRQRRKALLEHVERIRAHAHQSVAFADDLEILDAACDRALRSMA